jgi:hypothetical protein
MLVKALNSTDYDQSPQGVLFREAKFLISTQFTCVEVNYVSRSCCNGCVHALARLGMSWDPDQTCIWVDPLLKLIKILMVYDIGESSMI